MFFSLFASKNSKLVKTWKQEHKDIVTGATAVISLYEEKEFKKLQKELYALRLLVLNHLMKEDIEFFKLLKDSEDLDNVTEMLLNEFKKSFRGTKRAVMDFLRDYSEVDAVYTDEFIDTFKSIVETLGQRIAFEENNLYAALEG